MADLKCKCSTPYGQGYIIVNCTESSCEKCCPRTLIEEVDRFSDNPTNTNSFGFNNKFDGRVRGGIKTPNAFNRKNAIVGKEFNIFEENPKNNNMNYQNKGFNVNPNRSKKRIVKLHPLDVLKQKRVKGAVVYDPVAKMWKVDDLRPRGWDEKGIAGCWGSCKIKRPWFLFGLGGGSSSCKCNKAQNGCACDGCLGGASC